jgi:NitT/TauT family transport system permease protein
MSTIDMNTAVPSAAVVAKPGFIRRRPDVVLGPLILIVLLLAWEFGVKTFHVPRFVLPPPSAVAMALYAGLTEGTAAGGFWYHIGVTFSEAMMGFVLGSILGILLGFALSTWEMAERTVYPYVVAFQSLPKVAIAPLFLVWFGFGLESKIILCTISTFFPMLVASMAGCRSVDPDRIDMARSCCASRLVIFRRVVLPSAMPFLFAGFNMSIVLSMVGALTSEFVGSNAGLGMLLISFQNAMQIDAMFALLIVLMVIGFLLNRIVRFAERKLCFWAHRSNNKS